MKLQYLGDTHDFLKYFILRQLSTATPKIGVIWMVTPNDGGTDGSIRHHLNNQEKYKHLDPELFDKLEDIGKGKDHLQIGYLRAINLIPNAVYHEEFIPEKGETNRNDYWKRALKSVAGSSLIFVDPDNGMKIRSVTKGSVRSGHYIWYDEINQLLDMAPVLIYQHFPREKREEYIERRINDLKTYCGAKSIRVIVTSQVGFFLIDQSGHERFEPILSSVGRQLNHLKVKIW